MHDKNKKLINKAHFDIMKEGRKTHTHSAENKFLVFYFQINYRWLDFNSTQWNKFKVIYQRE